MRDKKKYFFFNLSHTNVSLYKMTRKDIFFLMGNMRDKIFPTARKKKTLAVKRRVLIFLISVNLHLIFSTPSTLITAKVLTRNLGYAFCSTCFRDKIVERS